MATTAGDWQAAADAAAESAESARRHRDRAGLAEALELRAATETAPRTTIEALREAARTWHGTGSTLDTDRVAVRLGGAPGATAQERLDARRAQSRLDAAGVVLPLLTSRDLAGAGQVTAPTVTIQTLGRFEVAVAGEAVPVSGWQSRKARDLLRILIARRGRMVPREELSALLWGNDPSERVGHRLSVALSTLRSVLDPVRAAPAGYYVVGPSGGIGLDLSHLTVDLESFLADAELGLTLYARGEAGDAHTLLTSAAAAYTGDFCEDEPFEDWSAPTREEARATYLRVVRALADLAARAGRSDEAAGHLLRLLHLDRYDEPSHRELVRLLTAAGRHGEARRAQARYRSAMREFGPVGSAR